MTNWNIKFINLATNIANWSKDTSTKCGAVIVNNDNRILSLGYNGFPQGVNDNISERFERPIKYLFTEHAERNAIYSAARLGISLKDCTIYVSTIGNNLFVCSDCARAIIQSGINNIVLFEPDWNMERYKENFEISKQMLTEAGVNIKTL